jgi:hypothetical protein
MREQVPQFVKSEINQTEERNALAQDEGIGPDHQAPNHTRDVASRIAPTEAIFHTDGIGGVAARLDPSTSPRFDRELVDLLSYLRVSSHRYSRVVSPLAWISAARSLPK